MMDNFKSELVKRERRWKRRLKLQFENGGLAFLVWAFSLFFRIIHNTIYVFFVGLCGRAIGCVHSCSKSQKTLSPSVQFDLANDFYTISWTVVLSVGYCLAFCNINGWKQSSFCLASPISDGIFSIPLVFFVSILSLTRLIEIFFFLFFLHADGKYTTKHKFRAVINTLWHYIEVTIAFSTLYVMTALWSDDHFSDTCCSNLLDEFWNPLYFSFVTISTLGYGDFSPQYFWGKFLVVSQILFGFYLLIIILQDAMSSSSNENDKQVS